MRNSEFGVRSAEFPQPEGCVPIRRYLATVLGLLLLCSGSAQGQAITNAAGSKSPSQPHYPTEKEVDKIIKRGVTKKAVIQAFGEPVREDQLPHYGSVADYEWFPELGRVNAYNIFEGFEVYYTNDIVAKWLPTYGSQQMWGATNADEHDFVADAKEQKQASATNESAKLSFYVVSDEPSEGCVFIDTPKLPKLGYVSTNADLTVLQLESAKESVPRNKDSQEGGSTMFYIKLTTTDAQAFALLTSKNIGKRLLLSIGRSPIIAPRISAPISTGEINMTGSDEETAQILGRLLPLMLKPEGNSH
jgi:hypothetical protein